MAGTPSTSTGTTGPSFLQGGGDMGARIRAFDWTRTPLGPPDQWPVGLKTAVRIMLTSRQAMWIGWGPELTYLYNDPYKSIIGGKHPAALGQPTSIVWREIWSEIAPMLATAMRGDEGTYVESQLLIMERNGYPEETYYTFSYSPIPGDDERAGGIFCANTDDTASVIRERQLSMLRLLAAVGAESRTIPDACAASARALDSNRRDVPFALLYLLDQSSGSLLLAARSGIDADHPAAPATIASGDASVWPTEEALQGHAPVLLGLTAMRPPFPSGDWDRPPHHAVIAPLARRGQADPTGLLVLGLNPYRLYDESYRGFTELLASQVAGALANARAYEEERRRAEALAEIDRAKTVFFSNVSHEFRTPLTLMLGPLEELRTNLDSADVRDQAVLVHRNALRLLRLVNTLLDFSRIEAGRARASYEPVDIAAYTAELASIFRAATERAGIALRIDCEPAGEVFLDRDMWERIVFNLVSNAFKYTFDGEIIVSVRRAGDAVRLDVRDTGTGIPAQELPRIFDRFHRIDGARGRTHEGSGIGLALVQELVRLHGGTVSVASEEGQGSTFTVTVPVGTAHLPAERVRAESATPASVASDTNPFLAEALRWLPGDPSSDDGVDAPDGEAVSPVLRERVIVADDNADMRDYVRRLLQTRWTVDVVANGRQALEAARRSAPDLILTDVMMPELDGFGLIAAIRADPDLREIPVIMLSARAGEEATLEGLHAGADDYLVKPFSARELIARAEAQLLRARIRAVEERHTRRLASVFAQAPVAIALLRGPDHVFELANPLYIALLHGRDVVGKPVHEALPEVEGQGLIALLDGVYQTGEAYVGRSLPLVVNRGAHGEPEECFFDFVYQPLFDADGRVEGIGAVVYDVTDLARARSDAELANRTKDEFLAMLGHELRNPLAPILTALQLLRLRGVDAIERERQVIERQVAHMVSLVDDLLDVSRITRGKVQLQVAPTELAAIVAKAIETASPLLEQNRHVLRVDVPQGLVVNADESRLAQVFANLLTNAAKYTETAGQITVTGREEDGRIVVRVRDTGIGIARDVLPRIFDLFVQERQALDRARGGLGLGLAIVRSLVAMHGGTVAATSDGPGRGAEFTVRLPSAEATAVRALAVATSQALQPAAIRRRVLIVDDNRDAATMLAESLLLYGHDVRCANDGPSALDLARMFTPDVALLDLGLPVMDGYELARRFAEDPHLRRTRIVAVTGYGQDGDRERSVAAGFSAHLVKPVDLDQVRAMVEETGDPGG